MTELPALPEGYTWYLIVTKAVRDGESVIKGEWTHAEIPNGGGIIGPDADGKAYELGAVIHTNRPHGVTGEYVFAHTLEELHAKALDKIANWR